MAGVGGGVDSVAFASGMAAISSVLLSLLKPGDEVIAHRVLYGSAWNLVTHILPQYGTQSRLLNFTNSAALADQIGPETKVIYFETPVNPSMEIIDIAAICQAAKERGVKVVVDNTFATPYFQQPLALGADVVVHSATKYISGHGDVVAGMEIGRAHV